MAEHHPHHDHQHHHAGTAIAARPGLSLLAVDARWRLLGATAVLLLFWGTVLWALA